MSGKHKESRKPVLADWIVTLATQSGNVTKGFPHEQALVTGAVFTRDERNGYVFTDGQGVTADFAPGTVLHVMRKDPDPLQEAMNADPVGAFGAFGSPEASASSRASR
jgi:hypothetical protein